MPDFEKQHYVPNGILKGFGTRKPNKKYEVCLIDLAESKVEYRNTESAMHEKNIYDIAGEDPKLLEKRFKTEIEDPLYAIAQKLKNDKKEIHLTRRELEVIKKYMLIQIFRSAPNREGYSNPQKGKNLMSNYNIMEGESQLDFWKREMMSIIENDWDHLVDMDLVSVKLHARMIFKGFLLFFRTDEEFIINDLGVVTERFPVKISNQEFENTIKIFERDLGISLDEKTVEIMKSKEQYIDTGIWMPLSKDLAVVCVHELFRYWFTSPMFLYMLPIPIQESKLFGFLSLPDKIFINQVKIDTDFKNMVEAHESDLEKLAEEDMYIFLNSLMDGAIIKNKDKNDRYKYAVHTLNKHITMEWNLSVMNEAHRYLCFKTPTKLIPAIKEYNQLKAIGWTNMKKDYAGYIEQLESLKRN